MDVIQLCFQYIDTIARDFHFRGQAEFNEIANESLLDLNIRFKENNMGYRFENRRIIRIDSEFMYKEVTEPVLKLLNAPEYSGVQDEFLVAYKHYRNGDKKDVLNNCLKAFESMMKVICAKHGWTYNQNDTAKALKASRLTFIDSTVPVEVVPGE